MHDEYDDLSEEVSNTQKSGVFEIDGLIALEDLAEQTGVEIPEGPYETLSGYVMHELGRIPEVSDVVEVPGAQIKVLSMEG
ncbi:MAG: transporter associated domain-containing protein, partial [Actinomycetota bacterium]